MKALITLLLALATFWPATSGAESQKKIGVILPLSGNAASYGGQFRQGMELSPAGRRFRLLYEDSRFDSKTALTAYEKLVKVEKVDFLVSFGGATCAVLNAAAQRDKLLHLAAGCNTAPFNLGDSYSFRLDVNEALAAAKTAGYLQRQGVKKAAFLYLQNNWAETIINSTQQAFQKAGIELTDKISFREDSATDVRAELLKLKANAPQTIFLIALPDILPAILRQMRELRISTAIMSNISIENPEVLRLSGGSAEGITYLSVSAFPGSRAKFAGFYQVFPDGNPFAAWGFDSLLLISHAAASTEPRKTLQQLDHFPGAFNNYDFNQSGELNLPYEIREIKQGRYVTREKL